MQSTAQYYLQKKIARGGMAEIYRGIASDQHGMQRTVVIKKILPQLTANREFVDMLIAEAKIAVMLSHGNIAQIYDLGKAGDDYFIVMEYVEGKSLSQMQRAVQATGEPFPIALACYIGAEIAAGLDYMHGRTDERGQPLHIVHRDVSPQNVLVNTGGTVKIIDFGIAKARTTIDNTESGILKGKFAYMSPEHASADAIDHRSDIFSLGVILHELLTGRRLFKGADNKETLRNVRTLAVAPPSSIRADVPVLLDAIVLRALARSREDRFFRAAEMRSELLKLLHQRYPEFRSQQLAEFLHTLFPNLGEEFFNDETVKTPLLIIDQTRSALVGPIAPVVEDTGIPAVMQQFMLEDDARLESRVARNGEEPVATPAPEIEEPSCTMAQTRWRLPNFSARTRLIFLSTLCVMAVGVLWSRHPQWTGSAWQTMQHAFTPRHQLTRVVPTPEDVALAPVTWHVNSTPSGATIFLDDHDTGLRTPADLTALPPGTTHRVGCFLAGHTFITREIAASAMPGASQEITVALPTEYGTLRIETTPAGANVSMNNVHVGTTPFTRTNLSVGHIVHLEVTKPGFAPLIRDVRIPTGGEAIIREPLQRRATP